MLKRDRSGNVRWDDSDVPEGWAGSYHLGDGVWRQKCRACPETFDSTGAYSVPRYAGIGPHEHSQHGLDVPGINVGILA